MPGWPIGIGSRNPPEYNLFRVYFGLRALLKKRHISTGFLALGPASLRRKPIAMFVRRRRPASVTVARAYHLRQIWCFPRRAGR